MPNLNNPQMLYYTPLSQEDIRWNFEKVKWASTFCKEMKKVTLLKKCEDIVTKNQHPMQSEA